MQKTQNMQKIRKIQKIQTMPNTQKIKNIENIQNARLSITNMNVVRILYVYTYTCMYVYGCICGLSPSHQQPAHANPSCAKGECCLDTENTKDTEHTEPETI